MRLPELKQLNCFREVARAGHFGRAARALGISHSALTEQIQRLEDAMGHRLLERDRKGVVPTPQGALFLEHVTGILNRVEDAVQAVRSGISSDMPRLHIGLSDAAFGTAVPALLQTLRREIPSVRIQISECSGIDAERALLEDGMDCLFIAYPPPSENLVSIFVGEVPMAACFPLDHPLASKSTLELADLHEQEIIFIGNYPHRQAHRAFFDACEAVNAYPRIGPNSRQLLTVYTLVASGLGIGIIQDQLPPPAGLSVTCRPIVNPQLTIPTNLVHRTNPQNPLIQLLVEILNRCPPGKINQRQITGIL